MSFSALDIDPRLFIEIMGSYRRYDLAFAYLVIMVDHESFAGLLLGGKPTAGILTY